MIGTLRLARPGSPCPTSGLHIVPLPCMTPTSSSAPLINMRNSMLGITEAKALSYESEITRALRMTTSMYHSAGEPSTCTLGYMLHRTYSDTGHRSRVVHVVLAAEGRDAWRVSAPPGTLLHHRPVRRPRSRLIVTDLHDNIPLYFLKSPSRIKVTSCLHQDADSRLYRSGIFLLALRMRGRH
jgi:hypothetical protein